jgi:cell division septation protein DedD
MRDDDKEEQLGFDRDDLLPRDQQQDRQAPDLSQLLDDEEDDEVVEESYSAAYPEQADEFLLEGDLPEDQQEVDALWDDNSADSTDENVSWEESEDDRESEEQQQSSAAQDEYSQPETSLPPLTATATLSEEPQWSHPDDSDDPEEWLEDEDSAEDDQDDGPAWPIGLIAIAVVALLLLAAGGYGVMQQRSAANDELRDLRAALATAVAPEEAASNRTAVRDLGQQNEALTASIESLQLENRQLSDTVAGLEAQLAAQQAAAAAKPVPKPKVVTPKPKPAAKTTPSSKAAASDGSWFVNFSSYSQRETAERWLTQLKPSSGKVIIAQAQGNKGVIYRLRVVGLTSKNNAQEVARQLEQTHGVEELWVGQQ